MKSRGQIIGSSGRGGALPHRALVRQGSGLVAFAEKISDHRSLAFDIDPTSGLAPERVSYPRVSCFGNVDPAGQTIAFQPTGGIPGVAPDVIDEFVASNDSSNDVAG